MCGPRDTEIECYGHEVLKPQPPTWRNVGKKRASANGVGWSASRVGREDNHAKPEMRARAPWSVGRFYTGRSARGPRGTGSKHCGHEVPKPQSPTWRGVGAGEPGPTAWLHVGREDNQANSGSAHVLRGRSDGSPRDEARSSREARNLDVAITTFTPNCRRPGAVSALSSLGQRRGVEREDNLAKSASARVLRGWSSVSPRGEKHARRLSRDSNAANKTY